MKKDLIVCLVLAGLFCCCLATEDDFPVHVAQGCSISNKIYDNLHGKINEDPIKKGIVPARFPIFIGTKWCGPGTKAEEVDELHTWFPHLDSCCREHDLCPASISGKETRYGLTNDGKYTNSHCTCDRRFHMCLLVNRWSDKNPTSSFIVNKLFDWFNGDKCFDVDIEVPPESSCLLRGMSKAHFGKCLWYRMDNNYTAKNKMRFEKYFQDGEQTKFYKYFDYGLKKYKFNATGELRRQIQELRESYRPKSLRDF